MAYSAASNQQTPSGRWEIYTNNKTIEFDSAADAGQYLREQGVESVRFDVDGNGCEIMIPASWIGDCARIENSSRVDQLMMVHNFLSAAGYSHEQVAHGMAYAEEIGYDSADEQGQLALSRILYTDDQLTSGELVAWEQVDWAEWAD